MIGGNLGDTYGLRATMILAAVMIGLALLSSFFIKETRTINEN